MTTDEIMRLARQYCVAFRNYTDIDGNKVSADNARDALRAAIDTATTSITKEDASNYCKILTILGMEEEGDPVAKVAELVEMEMRQNDRDSYQAHSCDIEGCAVCDPCYGL